MSTKYDNLSLNKIKTINTYENYNTLKDYNEIFWSESQLQLKDRNESLIKEGGKRLPPNINRKEYSIKMNKIRAIAITDIDLKKRIKEKETNENRKLSLAEKHILREEYKIEKFMEMSTLNRQQAREIIDNDLSFVTKGNTVVFLLTPDSVAKKKKKKEDSERVEVKTNIRISNPNIRYGYFQKFKADNTGKVFILIKDIQRRYIGEKLEASPTAYSYSMIGLERIVRMFVQSSGKWIEFTNDSTKEVDDVWKELENE